LLFWDDLVKDYFTSRAAMNTTLCKDNKRVSRSARARVASAKSHSRIPLIAIPYHSSFSGDDSLA
ncbi:hypothetical protein EDC04DRAFT_2566682, partial [Pisolithus marmoratus]